MYQNQTFESIMERMLSRIPNTLDKREGSIIWDALAPCALELSQMYVSLDSSVDEGFADTATREYLIRRAEERGLSPIPASKAVVEATIEPTELDIPIGTRFSCDALNYVVIEKLEDGVYKLECEEYGTVANGNIGSLIPINYISGLQNAEITEILIPAQDEEDTEVFRARYMDSFKTIAFGGNIAEYKQVTNAIGGVGATKVTPVWNGGGTVKLTILDSEYNVASEALVELVQETIDPTQDASGIGIAPIGHIVTVESAEAVEISVSTHLTFRSGYSYDALKSQIESAVSDYLEELRRDWADTTETVVRIAQIEARILNIQGIDDIDTTSINGTSANLSIGAYAIPTFKEVVVS